jgi:hypothetical protein
LTHSRLSPRARGSKRPTRPLNFQTSIHNLNPVR